MAVRVCVTFNVCQWMECLLVICHAKSKLSSKMWHRIQRYIIEIYRENMPLWNIRSEEFHDKQLKSVCYDKLITKMKQVLPSTKKINVTRKINTYTHIHTHTLTYMCVCTVFYVCTGFHISCACVCAHIHHIFNCIP